MKGKASWKCGNGMMTEKENMHQGNRTVEELKDIVFVLLLVSIIINSLISISIVALAFIGNVQITLFIIVW